MMKNGKNLKGNKMSTRGRDSAGRKRIERIARRVKQRLILSIALLIAIVLILSFRVGEAFWPAWLFEARILFRGITLLIVTFLILLSPVIIDADSNPRPLRGPGKNPYFWN